MAFEISEHLKEISLNFSKIDQFTDANLRLQLSPKITTLIGPNGVGKSTALEATALALGLIVESGRIEKDINELRLLFEPVIFETEQSWEACNVEFIFGKPISLPVQRGLNVLELDEKITVEKISFRIQRAQDNLIIAEVSFDDKKFSIDIQDGSALKDTEAMGDLKTELARLEAQLRNTRPAPAQAEIREKIKAKKEMIVSNSKTCIIINNSLVGFNLFINIWRNLKISLTFVSGRASAEKYLKDLVNTFFVLNNKAGADRTNSEYSRLRNDLETFLKCEVDRKIEKNQLELLIDGRLITQLSVGTKLALAFFAISRAGGKRNRIILWDEPENSLHPTRRIKLLDLMKNDKALFLIATHATEMVPVAFSNSKTYKFTSRFHRKVADIDQFAVCSVSKVENLSDLYKVLEDLGLEPNRILFTANCIIWLEGPSDLIYLRFFINKYFEEEQGSEPLLEGFDYTFLFTGGGLLKHLKVIDSPAPFEEEKPIDTWSNVFRIVPENIFLCDTDLKDQKWLPTISESDSILDEESFRMELKPQVREIYDCIKSLQSEGKAQYSKVYLTWGTEIENYLTGPLLKRALKSFYKISPSQKVEYELIEKVEHGRWGNFLTNLEKAFLEQESSLRYLSKGKTYKVSRYDELKRKIALAQSFVSESEKKGFSLIELADKGKFVKDLIEKLRSIKEKYIQ